MIWDFSPELSNWWKFQTHWTMRSGWKIITKFHGQTSNHSELYFKNIIVKSVKDKHTHTFDGCRESRLDSVNLHASKLFPQLLLLSCPLCRHHSALHLDAQRPLHQRVATGCVLHLALPEAAGALIQIAVHLTAVWHLATTVQMLSNFFGLY